MGHTSAVKHKIKLDNNTPLKKGIVLYGALAVLGQVQ